MKIARKGDSVDFLKGRMRIGLSAEVSAIWPAY